MNTRKFLLWSIPLYFLVGCTAYAGPRGVVGVTPVASVRVVAPVRLRVSLPPPVPPGRVLVRPARPRGGYVWRTGHWVHAADRYSWVAGAWVRPPRGKKTWTSGYWRRQKRGGIWISGYWS